MSHHTAFTATAAKGMNKVIIIIRYYFLLLYEQKSNSSLKRRLMSYLFTRNIVYNKIQTTN